MDICIASDDNYSPIMTVLIISVFENNRNASEITIHVFEDNISIIHKKNLLSIAEKYNRNIIFYNIKNYIDSLRNNINNDWANRNSYVAYARLYMPEMLPPTVKTFLYLDCDTLVCCSLDDLFNTNLDDYVIGAIRDVLPSCYKEKLGLNEYFNSGILLVNKRQWLEQNISKDIMEYCNAHQDDLYPDQDAINIILNKKIKILPPKYCVFYTENMASTKAQIFWYGDAKTYYNPIELNEANCSPVIIHYTDTILGRPWQKNNINPYSHIWLKYYDMMDLSMKFTFRDKHLSTNQKLFRIIYKWMPFIIFINLYYFRRNQGIRNN